MNAIIVDDDTLSAELLKQFTTQAGFIHIVETFSDPVPALTFLLHQPIDLILLDIEMPGMNGMEFMKAMQRHPHIILVTSHREFAPDAFEYGVVDYLVKPFTYARFFKAVSAVKELEGRKSTEDAEEEEEIVFVKKENQMISIRKSEIIWIEALGDYAVLHTAKDKFVLHSTLKAIGEKLSPRTYIRVHRSFIVRMDKIERIEDNTIFCDKKSIPIGKSYHDEVFRRLKMF